LAEIAMENGKSVAGLVGALVSAAGKAIDEAVADGRLTQERADELKSKLDERIESFVNAEFGEHGRGFHRGFGAGGTSPRGPPGFDGPHA
jgi:polyhydroxyalkanoate synthesis regulator phasin